MLTDVGSWRWTLFINVPIGLAVIVLAPRFVTETPRRSGRFDVVGALTATGGSRRPGGTLIGTPEHGWVSARTVAGFAVGVACWPCWRAPSCGTRTRWCSRTWSATATASARWP